MMVSASVRVALCCALLAVSAAALSVSPLFSPRECDVNVDGADAHHFTYA